MTGTVHGDQYAVFIMSRSVLLRLRNMEWRTKNRPAVS